MSGHDQANILGKKLYYFQNFYSFFYDISKLIHIKKENASLVQENSNLKQQLIQLSQTPHQLEHKLKTDKYTVIAAKVVNSTVLHSQNYITLDKGYSQGVRIDMGVVSNEGVVGKVKSVSKNFSIVLPILHPSFLVSAKIQENGIVGTLKWDFHNVKYAQLLCIPDHVDIPEKSLVVTSGYNSVFSEGIIIGSIESVKNIKQPFLDIKVKLSTDFTKLEHLYIISDNSKKEKLELENSTKKIYE